MEFQVRDRVMLKVSPWKGVVCFGKRGKLNPRYVGPFKVVARVGSVAYKLDLLEELSRVHNTFHVSNQKKCYANEPLAILLDGLHFDDKLQFVEEPVEIMDRKVKRLRNSHVPIVKVRWNSRRGPEFTWEREDQFKKKYPHLFTKTAPSSSATFGTHLIKDCNFYEKQMVNKSVGIGVGPVHSRNQVNHSNQFVPQAVLLRTGKENPFLDAEVEGIFNSGCSRSMTGNKERLDDFQVIQGRKVTFGGEFKNALMIELCGSKGIKREYSNARTPQQNRVAERKNKTLIETARTMLADSKLPTMFWTEAADEGYIIVGYSASNKAYRVYNMSNKRVEETMNLRFLEEKPNVQGRGHECILGTEPKDTLGDEVDDSLLNSAYEIFQKELARLKGQEQRATFDAESLGLGFVDDSLLNSAYEIFQKELARLKGQEQRATSDAESLGLGFANDAVELQKTTSAKTVPPGSFPVPAGATVVSTDDVPVYSSSSTDSFFDDEPTPRFPCPSVLRNHDPSPGIFSSSLYNEEFGAALNNVASTVEVSSVVTKRINTIHHQSLIIGDPTLALQTKSKEEMQQFKFQNVWVLVDLPAAQGHRQEEDNDYDEVFTPVARIKAIRLFLAFASYIGFMVYQMDVKSAFIYERIDEEVYVTQPRGFVDPQHPKKFYKVVKALYGLHQALRAWYATVSTFLLKHGYKRGTIYKTLFLKKNKRDIILVQVYVDDIIFGSTKKAWCDEFKALMTEEFQMSAMGELTFFLGLQV
uniref:Putative ribonuclease H-like domain-containing protein n=1 Tax=Tanacetum cinerariifolium TaxID=118510 RepID=A0A6L2MP49_TANCI|nr:putative ribonuclease H-like domain-containing protein [Tanacetum cinerariifolium]